MWGPAPPISTLLKEILKRELLVEGGGQNNFLVGIATTFLNCVEWINFFIKQYNL